MINLTNLKEEFRHLKRPMRRAILEVLESGTYILGPQVKELERQMSIRFHHAFTLGVASGTDALLLALEALGIGPGDEVITTPFSFFATVGTILRIGASPVFVDIDPHTFNLNPNHLEGAVTQRTKAIIPVHLFGQCADMKPIMELAHRHGLYVIEDACQAFGATYQGLPAGIIGDVGCFSFYPTKNLGAFGDAGLVATKDQTIFERITLLRNHGSKHRYIHEQIGTNSRLDEIQAAVLLVKLQIVDEWIKQRQHIAHQYSQELSGLYDVPVIRNDRNHVFHQYSLQHSNRDELFSFLKQHGIQAQVYYPLPLHLQPALHSAWRTGDFPVAERVSSRIFSIPLYPTMKNRDVRKIIDVMRAFGVKDS